MFTFSWWRKLSPLMAALCLVSACNSSQQSINKRSNPGGDTLSAESGDLSTSASDGYVTGFKNGFYLLMQQNCGECHGESEPAFTHYNADKALDVTKNWSSTMAGFEGDILANFSNPAESRL